MDDFKLKVRHCWATPTSDPDGLVRYDFIDSFQVIQSEQSDVAIIENCSSSQASFSVNSFTFDGADKVYFHCEINVCDATNSDCSCTSDLGKKRRDKKRRSADGDGNATLKIGPITVE